jgi:hypothetical protein
MKANDIFDFGYIMLVSCTGGLDLYDDELKFDENDDTSVIE